MYLELFVSFCRLLKVALKGAAEGVETVVVKTTQGAMGEESVKTEDNYLEICREVQQIPKLEVGAKRERNHLLLGMRFFVSGYFKDMTKDKLEALNRELGGIVLARSSAELILKKHSQTPHCYIVLQDPPSSLASSSSGKNKISSFASGDWKFINWRYIKDTSSSDKVIDVASYLFESFEHARTIRVNDVRPLLQLQTQSINKPTVSAISALKTHRNKTHVSKVISSE